MSGSPLDGAPWWARAIITAAFYVVAAFDKMKRKLKPRA